MKWQPITDIDPDAKRWMSDFYREALEEWRDLSAKLKDPDTDRTALDLWTRERNRMMAIETGQIEDLYTMRQGITEQLITEGLEHARASHTVEQGLADDTLRGLLLDQHDALEMVFQCVSDERPISESVIKEWHALLTRHQELAPGRDSQGRRIGIPFTKGAYKRRPNNPRRPDGVIHQYCPPEHTTSEMEHLLAMHRKHEETDPFPTPVEAAWLHHRFVQIHPFEDGNGRTARLLMSYVYAKRNEPPPIVAAVEKPSYIATLEQADNGNLKAFVDMLEEGTFLALRACSRIARNALEKTGRFHHMNGDISAQNGHKDWTHHRAEENDVFGPPADPDNPATRAAREAADEGRGKARSSQSGTKPDRSKGRD